MIENRTESAYCTCGRLFESKAAQEAHKRLQGEINIHNHEALKSPPRTFDAASHMFGIWAIDRAVTSEGADILIHAMCHIHCADVVDRLREGHPILSARGTYRHVYLMRLVFPFLSSKKLLPLNSTNLEIAQQIQSAIDLKISPHELVPVISEWKRTAQRLEVR